MNKRTLLGATALRTFAAVGLAAGMMTPAFAQEVAEEQDPAVTLESEQEIESGEDAQGPDAAADEAIIVTGSRIRRPNLESPLPVTSVGGDEFFETGSVSIGDTLNDLPALRSTFSQANSTRFLGTAGLNLLDLRGLGTVRTLVLQNGRRHVGGDVLSSGVTPDVNTMPTDLIERVDVVTGGNSAVYGSDAIAGVVNFILKRDYEGFEVRAQGGISKYEDAGSFFGSALWGTNFADGRGNVAVNVEYARQNQFFGAERPFLNQVNNFVVVDTDTEGSDGDPDRVYFEDVRNGQYTNYGQIAFTTGECGTDPLGANYACLFTFTPDGNLIPVTGDRIGLAPFGNTIGGNGESFRYGRQLQVQPNLDRYNVNALAHFEVSPAFVPFVEAKWSRTDVIGTGASGPAFTSGATYGDPFQISNLYGFDFTGINREQISINNPYLTDQARDLIIAQRAAAGLATTDATRLSIRENLAGLVARNEQTRRDTYRIVGGVRGDIGGPWNYEVALNYGRLEEENRIGGNLNIQRYLLAVDAVEDPDSGEIVCRSQIDPNAAFGYYPWVYNVAAGTGDPNAPARLAADVAQCTPINILGGQFTDEQRAYLLQDTIAKGKVSQFDAVAFISGDTSQFFELPGGPIGIVVGAEYREDNLFYQQDDLVQQGYTFYNIIPTFEAPKSKVKEAFGEIRLPLLRDFPLAHELTLSAAGRVSDYSVGSTGTVYAYSGSAEWAPIQDLRLRGNYARSVRAPNQAELFAIPGQNFAPGFTDPCALNQIGQGTSLRETNCRNDGVPDDFNYVYQSSLEIVSGGNELLEAETSDSYTVGGVLTPRFLPGFSLTVDYYDITVDKSINAVLAQQIANLCYDLAAGNPYCDLFERAGPGGADTGEEEGRILEGSLLQGPVNFAKLTARGIDAEVAYRGQIGSLGRLDTKFTYTHVLERTNFTNPGDPTFGNRALSEIGDPQDAFNWNTSLQTGRFTLGYQMRFIGKQIIAVGTLGEYEDFFEFEGRDPVNPDFADRVWYPSRFYHDLRLGIDVGERYNFYLGADNVTNTKPPLNNTGIGGGSGIYDARGRYYYAGFVAKF